MSLEFANPEAASDITSVLRRRGLEPKGKGSVLNTLYPEDQIVQVLEKHGQSKFYEYFPDGNILSPYLDFFGENRFRKLIRRLLRDGRQWVSIDEIELIAGSKTSEYLDFLERLLLVDRHDQTISLLRNVNDLGASLEHYTAHICIRDLRGSAEWGIHLENLPRSDSGGDFDVLAWLEPSLVYVECKSSPPSSVDNSQIREFLQRSIELAPDLAIMLIDTEDDITPFVQKRVNPIISEEASVLVELAEHPDYPRVFFGLHRVYLINARRTILGQIQKCLQHYYAHVKGVPRFSLRHRPEFVRSRVSD